MNDYQITVNEKHLRTILLALEGYSRAKAGQLDYALEHLWLQEKRPRMTKEVEKVLKHELFPELDGGVYYGIHSEKIHDDARKAFDMIQVFRHQLYLDNPDRGRWGVDSAPAMQTSQYCYLAKIERI